MKRVVYCQHVKEVIEILKRHFSSFGTINKIHVAGIYCPVCGKHYLLEARWHSCGTCLNNEASIERFCCESCGIEYGVWSQNLSTQHTEVCSEPIIFSIVLKQKSMRADNIVASIPLNELYFDGQNICFDICIEYRLINGIRLTRNADQAQALKSLADADGLVCLNAKFPVCKKDLMLARKSFCVLR